MIDLEQALSSPATVFESPEQVCSTQELTTAQRCSILRQWSYDLRELLVASDENMPPAAGSAKGLGDSGDTAELLTRVDTLLGKLAGDTERPAPTKQGGV